MNFTDHLSLIKRLHDLIRRKATGSPEELADRLNISRASLYRYINDLKSLGAPIKYNKERRCFGYEEPFDLKL